MNIRAAGFISITEKNRNIANFCLRQVVLYGIMIYFVNTISSFFTCQMPLSLNTTENNLSLYMCIFLHYLDQTCEKMCAPHVFEVETTEGWYGFTESSLSNLGSNTSATNEQDRLNLGFCSRTHSCADRCTNTFTN